MSKVSAGGKCVALPHVCLRATTIRRICIVGVLVAAFQSMFFIFHTRDSTIVTTLAKDEAAKDLFRNFAGMVDRHKMKAPPNVTNPRNNDVEPLKVPTHSLHDGKNITWMADLWIPPRGSRMYSANEMRQFFPNFSILFLGDSTIRRAYATLYAILNSTDDNIPLDNVDHENVLDRGKRGSQALHDSEICTQWVNSTLISTSSACRPMPTTGGKRRMDLISAPCFSEAIKMLQYDLKSHRNITRSYDLIVFSSGIWDTSEYKRFLCGSGKGYPGIVFQKHDDTLALFQQLQSQSLAIVYRTTGYHYRNFETKSLMALNKKTIDDIETFQRRTLNSTGRDSNLSYIDWGTPMLPRSVKDDRIPGNNDYHYGLKARLLFIQQLMNHLMLKRHKWIR